MYPPTPGAGPADQSPSGGKGAPKRPTGKTPKRRSSRKGFLAVLLAILVLAAVAAVLLLWYFPSRDAVEQDSDLAVATSTTVMTGLPGETVTTQGSETSDVTATTVLGGPIGSAEDIEAVVMLSNAMITIDSAFQGTNTFEPSVMTPEALKTVEPSITFLVRDTPQDAAKAPTGAVEESTIDFFGTRTDYALGTTSKSGTTFGVIVGDTAAGATTTYYVNGQAEDWTKLLTSGIIGGLLPRRG
jgi:hypothetical protein